MLLPVKSASVENAWADDGRYLSNSACLLELQGLSGATRVLEVGT